MKIPIILFFLFSLNPIIKCESKYLFAGFAFYDERTVVKDDAVLEVLLERECKCRELCIAHHCNTYGWIKRHFDIICRLSNEVFKFGAPTGYPLTNGHIAYRYSIPGLFLGSDNKFYFLEPQSLRFSEAENRCSSEGNFRVGIYKTVAEFMALKKAFEMINKEIWVDMDSVPASPHSQWSDGTWYNDTELAGSGLVSTFFNEYSSPPVKTRYDGTTLGDKPTEMENALYAVLCQEEEN